MEPGLYSGRSHRLPCGNKLWGIRSRRGRAGRRHCHGLAGPNRAARSEWASTVSDEDLVLGSCLWGPMELRRATKTSGSWWRLGQDSMAW